MKLPIGNPSPDHLRIYYDILVSMAAAVVGVAFGQTFFLHSTAVSPDAPSPLLPILCIPPLSLVAFDWVCTKLRGLSTSSGITRATRVTVSVAIAGTLVWLTTGDTATSVLWCLLVWAPLVLPRLLLNAGPSSPNSLIKSAVKRRGPVLVVGGAGYIGTHVVQQLLHSGSTVRVLDRFIYGKEPLGDLLNHPRLEVVEGDVTDLKQLTYAASGASAIVHLAGLVGDPACSVDNGFTRHANIISTRMLKEVALSMGIPRFIFASSCSVYGASEVEVDETSALNPVSLYAQSKIDSERELLSSGANSLCVTVLRFATVFGHSRRPRFDLVANLFTAQAYLDGVITDTSGMQWRPFIHVSDLARAIVKTLKAPAEIVRGQIFNVGDKKLNMTIGELADRVFAIVSRERKVELIRKPDSSDRRNYMVSFDKIHRVLAFEAAMSIEDGVLEILEEMKKGAYTHYRDAHYSNLEMTKRELSNFRDPLQSARLYHPISDNLSESEFVSAKTGT